jgi:hypothetical protein
MKWGIREGDPSLHAARFILESLVSQLRIPAILIAQSDRS